MSSSKLKKLGLIVPLLVCSAFHASNVNATCVPSGFFTGTPNVVNISVPENLIVQRDAPVGTVIWRSGNITAWPSQGWLTCDTPNIINGGYRNGWRPASTGIAPTNVAGIGIQFAFNTSVFTSNDTAITNGSLPGGNVAWGPTGNWIAFIWLVKTGPITGGSLSTGTLAGVAVRNEFWLTNFNIVNGGKISSAACSVKNTTISVPFGDIERRAFTGTGSTAGERTFNIPLDCDAQTRVNITLDATPDPSGAAGVIALDPVSSGTRADGVGIQLLRNRTPVALSTSFAIGTVATAGDYNIPFTARYYQTKSSVTPGQANGHATFTMTYN